MERGAGIVDRHTTAQAGAAVERDGAETLFIEVLVNLEQIGFVIHPGVQRLAQGRQLAAGDDDYRTVDFGDDADRDGLIFYKRCIGQRRASPWLYRRAGNSHGGTVKRLPLRPGIRVRVYLLSIVYR